MSFFKSPCDEGVITARKAPSTKCGGRNAAGLWPRPSSAPAWQLYDGTVVNVALLTLQKNLNARSPVQWVVEAYTLFLAALLCWAAHSAITLAKRFMPSAWPCCPRFCLVRLARTFIN